MALQRRRESEEGKRNKLEGPAGESGTKHYLKKEDGFEQYKSD